LVQQLATGWIESQGRQNFPAQSRPTLPPTPSLLCNEYWVTFPDVKWPVCGADHSPPFSAEVKERVVIPLLPSQPL